MARHHFDRNGRSQRSCSVGPTSIGAAADAEILPPEWSGITSITMASYSHTILWFPSEIFRLQLLACCILAHNWWIFTLSNDPARTSCLKADFEGEQSESSRYFRFEGKNNWIKSRVCSHNGCVIRCRVSTCRNGPHHPNQAHVLPASPTSAKTLQLIILQNQEKLIVQQDGINLRELQSHLDVLRMRMGVSIAVHEPLDLESKQHGRPSVSAPNLGHNRKVPFVQAHHSHSNECAQSCK